MVDYVQFNLHQPALRERARAARDRAGDRPQRSSRGAVYHGTLESSDSVQFDPRYRATAHLPAYDPAAARRVLAPWHPRLDLAIAGEWRNSANAAVQIAANLAAAGVTVQIALVQRSGILGREGSRWDSGERLGTISR